MDLGYGKGASLSGIWGNRQVERIVLYNISRQDLSS